MAPAPTPPARRPRIRLRAALALAAALVVALPAAAQAARSPFAWRGVVEGSYGTPWSHAQRLRMIEYLGPRGFNAYVHAPKRDTYQTADWRLPYPPDVQQQFGIEIIDAGYNRMQWVPNLSPALVTPPKTGQPQPGTGPICFTCADDFTALVNKYATFLNQGTRTVMLSFDDADQKLVWAQDIAAYGGSGPEAFGRATADVANRLLNALDEQWPGTRLLFVPSTYTGESDTPYLQGLRAANLNPQIGVLWTGPQLRASDFAASDANAFAGLIGRRPLVWENWLNNDLTPTRLFLGPYERTQNLAGAVGGFFFNPTDDPDLNLLPLSTAGDWMLNPRHYNPRRSWLKAIAQLADWKPALMQKLRAWAETSYSSTLVSQEAPTFAQLSGRFVNAYRRGGGWQVPYTAVDHELTLTQAAASGLKGLTDPWLARQARPALSAAAQMAAIGHVALALLAAERPYIMAHVSWKRVSGEVWAPEPARAQQIRSALDQQLNTPASPRSLNVYGCRTAARGCPQQFANAMDAFLNAVQSLDSAWSAKAQPATTPPKVLLRGRPIGVQPNGRFTLRPQRACGQVLVAVDAMGGATSIRLPRCPRPGRAHRRGH